MPALSKGTVDALNTFILEVQKMLQNSGFQNISLEYPAPKKLFSEIKDKTDYSYGKKQSLAGIVLAQEILNNLDHYISLKQKRKDEFLFYFEFIDKDHNNWIPFFCEQNPEISFQFLELMINLLETAPNSKNIAQGKKIQFALQTLSPLVSFDKIIQSYRTVLITQKETFLFFQSLKDKIVKKNLLYDSYSQLITQFNNLSISDENIEKEYNSLYVSLNTIISKMLSFPYFNFAVLSLTPNIFNNKEQVKNTHPSSGYGTYYILYNILQIELKTNIKFFIKNKSYPKGFYQLIKNQWNKNLFDDTVQQTKAILSDFIKSTKDKKKDQLLLNPLKNELNFFLHLPLHLEKLVELYKEFPFALIRELGRPIFLETDDETIKLYLNKITLFFRPHELKVLREEKESFYIENAILKRLSLHGIILELLKTIQIAIIDHEKLNIDKHLMPGAVAEKLLALRGQIIKIFDGLTLACEPSILLLTEQYDRLYQLKCHSIKNNYKEIIAINDILSCPSEKIDDDLKEIERILKNKTTPEVLLIIHEHIKIEGIRSCNDIPSCIKKINDVLTEKSLSIPEVTITSPEATNTYQQIESVLQNQKTRIQQLKYRNDLLHQQLDEKNKLLEDMHLAVKSLEGLTLLDQKNTILFTKKITNGHLNEQSKSFVHLINQLKSIENKIMIAINRLQDYQQQYSFNSLKLSSYIDKLRHGKQGQENALNHFNKSWLIDSQDIIIKQYNNYVHEQFIRAKLPSHNRMNGLLKKSITSILSAAQKNLITLPTGNLNTHSYKRYFLSYILEISTYLGQRNLDLDSDPLFFKVPAKNLYEDDEKKDVKKIVEKIKHSF